MIPTIRFLAIAFCLGGLAKTAGATEYSFSGSACAPEVSSTAYTNTYQGIRAESLTSDYYWFFCPITGNEGTTVDVSDATVRYWDDNSSHSVKCQLWATTETGTGYYSPFRYSCSLDTTNGCTSEYGAYQGTGGIKWTDPLNGGASLSNVSSYFAKCLLYGTGGTTGYSYVMSYRTNQTAP